MQQVICYYLSGFGFGHLTRSLAVMEHILTTRDDIHIMIKADPRLLAKAGQYLEKFSGRFSLHAFHSSFSIVTNPATFSVDFKATREDVLRWIAGLAASAEQEGDFLISSGVKLVLSDIVPEAFAAAKQVKRTGIGISNFTWYEICADFIREESALDKLLDMYRQADCMLVYPYATGKLIPITPKIEVGPAVRPFDQLKVAQIRRHYKQGERPLAFLSVGGSMRVEQFPFREDMDYLVTMGIDVPNAANVHPLEDIADSHNYLAACDVAITKCGWSTIAEATSAKTPLWLMLSQNGWLEERYIYREISALGIGRARSFSDMQNLTSAEISQELLQLRDAYRYLPMRYQNGSNTISKIIDTYLD